MRRVPAEGRLALMMGGQDAWGVPVEQVGAIGSNYWSGDVLGLDLPNNPMDPTFDPSAPPTEVTGSFISLNHAIKREGALQCMDCHSPAGVMDFNALSYSDEEIQHLQMLLQTVELLKTEPTGNGVLLRWACIPGETYRVECTPDLRNVAWVPVGPVTHSAGPWVEHVIPRSELGPEPQQFFRVVRIVP